MILRNKTQGGFTAISNNILRDQNLSMRDRGVLCTILSLPDNWDFSIEGLSKIVPDGKDALRVSIKHLERLGYLLRNTKCRTVRGRFSSTIEVFMEPHNENPPRDDINNFDQGGSGGDLSGSSEMNSCISITGSPRRDHRDGFSVTVNPTQSNTIHIKNKIKKTYPTTTMETEDLVAVKNNPYFIFLPPDVNLSDDDKRALLREAGDEPERIMDAISALEEQTTPIRNPVGWLIMAIRKKLSVSLDSPLEFNSRDKPSLPDTRNVFNRYQQQNYDFDTIYRCCVANL